MRVWRNGKRLINKIMVIKESSRLTEIAPRLAVKIELMKISAMQVRLLLLSLKPFFEYGRQTQTFFLRKQRAHA